MKKLTKIYYLLLWTILITPSVVLAWSPNEPIVPTCGDTGCHFYDLVALINNLLSFFIWIAVPISILVFAYIGWLYMTSGDNAGKRSDANKMFVALGKGLLLVLAAWLIVSTIMNGLGAEDYAGLLGNFKK